MHCTAYCKRTKHKYDALLRPYVVHTNSVSVPLNVDPALRDSGCGMRCVECVPVIVPTMP